MFDLSGKTALITGASGGIGNEIARILHAAGAKTALTGTRQEALQALADELGEGAFPLTADIATLDGITELMKAAETAIGPVDILVNNAGITRDNLALRMKDEDWAAVLDVNLTAAFRLARISLRNMIKNRFGRIINISSIVGTMGNAGQSNSAAAKAGMIGMSKALAQEVALRGVTVNCIAPGFIETPMTEALSEAQRADLASAIPAGRLGEGRDVAAAVLYLASDEAGYITGQTLHVNGGMIMI